MEKIEGERGLGWRERGKERRNGEEGRRTKREREQKSKPL